VYFVSAGIGIGCGFLIGVLCLLVSKNRSYELFYDKTVFLPSDSIAFTPSSAKTHEKRSEPNTHPSIR